MAEQEAVANVVASAVADRDIDADRTGSLQGESLLLPLLQELLDKKSVHQQQQQQQSGLMNRSASSQSSEESATATIDSGTESGEDLRLLAVGLCDSMDSTRSAGSVEPLGPGLLAEVQNALSRLAVSLQLDSPDVQMETERKQQLMQLVARLQANLVVTTKPPAERRLSSGQGRFSKNKNRQNRHTVGVSTEEIAAARKLMEEVVLRDSLSSSVTPDYVPTPPDFSLEKQNSDEHVANQVNYRTVNFSPQISTTVKNATPKPFNSSVESSQPLGFKSVSEPTTPHDTVIYRDKPNHGGYRQSLSLEGNSLGYIKTTEPVRPMSECIQMDYNPGNLDPWGLQHTQKTNNHIFQYPKAPDYNYKDQVESETDDDSSTVKQSEDADDLRHSPELTPTHMHYVTDVNTNRTITPVNEHVHFVPEQPEYIPSKQDIYSRDLSSAQRLLNIAINDDSKGPANRFNKKMKMKRANTIDIPKPLNYYEANDESDDSLDDRDDHLSTRRSNYLALRGPIRVGTGAKSTVPSFEPKTENDKKFMAFIQKHNNNNTNVTSLWQNKPAEVKKKPAPTGDHNWSRKFGNIKTIFEKEEDKSRPSSTSVTSAKQFWQSADDSIHAGKRSYNGPKINKQGTRQLQSIFEQKQKEPKLPWTTTEHNNIVTGNLKIESNFKPIQNNQLIQGKNYKFIPQPLPVNKFSHAPMSAFKPPPKRTPVQNAVQTHSYPMKQTLVKEENGKTSEPGTPLFLYTPKHLEFPQPVEHEEESKPPSSVPWIAGPGKSEHRVLQLAASKFENSSSREVSPTPTRKTSKDKVHIPLTLQNNGIDTYNQKQPYHSPDYNNKDLSSPFLVKNLQPSKQTVRKLSGEYDNNKIQQPLYKTNGETHIQPIHTVKQTVQKFTVPSDVAFNNNHNDISNGYKQYPQPPRKISDEFDHIYNNNKVENAIPYKPQRIRKVSGDYENDQFHNQQEIRQPVPKQTYQYTGEHQPQTSQQTHLQYPQQGVSTKNSYQCEQDDLPKQNYQYPEETKQPYQYPQDNQLALKQNYQYQESKSATPKQSYRYSEDAQPKQSYQYPQDNQLAPKIPYEYQPESRSPIPRIDTTPKQSYQYPEDIQPKQSTQYSQENQLAPRQSYQYQQESRSPIPKMDTAPKQSYKYPEDTQPKQSIQYTQESPLIQKQAYQYLPESKSPLPIKIDTQPKQIYQYPEDIQPKTQLAPQTYQYVQESKSPIPKQDTKPNKPILKLDFSSSGSSTTTTATPDILSSPAITSPMTEYTSVTRVMTGPVSQQAITVQQNTPKNRDEHDMARNLHNVLKKMNLTEDSEEKSQRSSIKPTLSPKPSYKSPTSQPKVVSPERKDSSSSHIKTEPDTKIYNSSKTSTAQNYSGGQHTKQYEPETTRSKPAVSPNYDSRNYSSQNRHYESDRPTRMIHTKPITTECLEINDEGESVVTTKLQIPVSGNVYYNNTTNAPRSRNLPDIQNARTPPPPPSVTLTKSDSWHKLTEPATSAKPSPRASPRASPNARNLLQKAKSSHSLAVPKQFEAGLKKDEVEQKKNSVAAYFGGSQPLLKTSSSTNLNRIEDSYRSSQQTTINRTNTMNKMSAQTRTSGLSRSRTMPDVVDMFEDSLDVDAEFENIFRASIAK